MARAPGGGSLGGPQAARKIYTAERCACTKGTVREGDRRKSPSSDSDCDCECHNCLRPVLHRHTTALSMVRAPVKNSSETECTSQPRTQQTQAEG